MKIDKTKSTAYHHQTLGTVERNHRVFNEYIRAYLDSELDLWDTYLHYFTFCYNITKHSSNENKYGPFELVFGRKINLQEEFLSGQVQPIYNIDNYVNTLKYILTKTHAKTRELIIKMKHRNKKTYDKFAKPLDINERDLVYVELEPYNKFSAKHGGPYEVVQISGSNVTVNIKDKLVEIHKDRIRK